MSTATTACPNVYDTSCQMGTTALLLLFLTILFGHSMSGIPLTELGQRPMGNGLWEWLFYQVSHGVGIWGYDSSLGAWSPLVRVSIHFSTMFGLWALALLLLGNADDTCLSSRTISVVGMFVSALYLTCFYVYFHWFPSVSHPGGPRASKIQRRAQWNQTDKPTLPSPDILKDWHVVVAEASHEVTEQVFQGTAASLTGEAAGRQIWTNAPTTTNHSTTNNKNTRGGKRVDERLVQEMASGGRPLGFDASVNPNSADQIFRAQQIRTYLKNNNNNKAPSNSKPKTVKEAAQKATHFYSMLQTSDGHWAGDYGGPHFLMPGLIVAWYVMGQPERMLNSSQVELMKHYIIVHQQADGGWGTHIESPSTMFGTTVMYVAIRLLGMDADMDVARKAREFIQKNGGAIMTSSWAKFYLCLLGCMDWEGHNSVPPEMWLLPNWFPFHPGRLWCHCRMVYLPMGYLYGSRFVYSQAETDPLIQSLRQELYCEPYESIEWNKTRHLVAPMDNYSPIPLLMSLAQDFLARYETWAIFQPLKIHLRAYGLKFCREYMAAEDLQTNYIDIGPVNKVLNFLSAYHAADGDLTHPTVVNHMMRVPDYLWIAEDGMKMQGYNGSQCWDTSFAIQAIYECGLLDEFPQVSTGVWSYLERCQILSTKTSQSSPAYEYESLANRDKFYRHVSEGGWPFSTSAHGWPISDCTGEGLKGVLCLATSKTIKDGLNAGTLEPIYDERLEKAVNVILTLQNEDGGWATYENNRGFGWYEQLNPSEVFGDIMIDYSYVECSMASLTALYEFHERCPLYRPQEIEHAIHKGKKFLKSIQRDDGSWYGSWACCFCYGVWFGIEGLVKAGEPTSSPEIERACKFLLSHQRKNGGWGEDFTSCYDKDYAKNGMDAYGDDGSGVVNTAWALLALSVAECSDVDAIKRGVQYLMKRQLPCGDWPQEGIAGVFNRACGITYTAYRNVFPIWALGRCAATYGDVLNE